ncbi:hypothetical protein V5F53_20065 [Xanthobacter sp. V4C-4]|uniref:nSTAND3 domain-containing NTPase n=1 Tax=Xanthobacter cornucopiae TaxID=3119924 RepID=UPI003727DC4C
MIEALQPYPLHLLGWNAFQELAVSVAEVCLSRPVQTFLPSSDAGRDGAFIGRWDGANPGRSTVQCKFTSKQGNNLSLSLLKDELKKAQRLVELGEADDYIIITNHHVTGESDLAIKAAFLKAGVKECRIFGADWINRQIRSSPKLRMLVPRLYGLGDLHDLLDGRAYQQAQMILSAMGDDLQRIVVTDAHRQSVKAIGDHNLVLLLGAPAAGKSTIGASIAVGAADRWQCSTVRATSADDLQRHLNPAGGQFFWIDDAWGSKQYQKQTAEAWNQVFPLMHSAMRRGTRFLITSRDYIWRSAKFDLKISAMPVLSKSQVVIDVHRLSNAERAQILYNHLKFGDQPTKFRSEVKPFLSALAKQSNFLPETARRLGSTFFAKNLPPIEGVLTNFFANPRDFLKETLTGLSPECRAAIAVVFLNGGKVRSPVSASELEAGASAFGVSVASVRNELEALNGSVLLLALDEQGHYWTYKHPTVSDAFSAYLAGSPELIEVYLRGAKAETILDEVVCAGESIQGASLVVPGSLNTLLVERIQNVHIAYLRTFMSYRSSKAVNALLINQRPDVLSGFNHFSAPITDDADSSLLSKLYRQGLLLEEHRLNFVASVMNNLINEGDASFLEDHYLERVLRSDEMDEVRRLAREKVLPRLDNYVDRLRSSWDPEYPPDELFNRLEESVMRLCDALTVNGVCDQTPMVTLAGLVKKAVYRMEDEYQPSPSPSGSSDAPKASSGLSDSIFRDVDE